MERARIVTVPNLMSTSRVALAVAFVVFDAVPARLALIAVASMTDFFDGWLARRTDTMSRIGALIDPIADRFFAVGVVVAYLFGGEFRAWHAVLVLFRDVMSIIGWFVARRVSWLRPITFRARRIGKVVTVAQLLSFLTVLVAPALVNWSVALVGALGFVATTDYTLMLWRERTPRIKRNALTSP